MILPLAILGPIKRPLLDILVWLHTSIGFSWAWSIIALTLLVRMVILPLTIKQIRSMQKLQAHAPELKALQQKYKGDKKRLNEEVMKFYKENKVNPAASCLPIALQIPVFISLFYVLRKDFPKTVLPKYPGSDLGWLHIVPSITDKINSHWAGWLLLAVYAGSQLSSSFFMSTTMQKSQRVLIMVLPIVFIPAIIRFPMGLMLYWTTTNLWTVGQGIITRQLAPKPQLPPPRTSKTPPKRSDDGDAGDGAKRPKPSPKPGAATAGGQSPQVRRRKKKGPQAGRKR